MCICCLPKFLTEQWQEDTHYWSVEYHWEDIIKTLYPGYKASEGPSLSILTERTMKMGMIMAVKRGGPHYCDYQTLPNDGMQESDPDKALLASQCVSLLTGLKNLEVKR